MFGHAKAKNLENSNILLFQRKSRAMARQTGSHQHKYPMPILVPPLGGSKCHVSVIDGSFKKV